jgi:hypothetical protein
MLYDFQRGRGGAGRPNYAIRAGILEMARRIPRREAVMLTIRQPGDRYPGTTSRYESGPPRSFSAQSRPPERRIEMIIATWRREMGRLFRSTKWSSSAWGLLVVLAVSSIAMSQPSAERLPLPADDVARQVIAEVQDVFRKEYATANTPQEKSALAKELAATAEKIGKPLERWGMLSEAGRLAADAGDVETAFAVVASLAKGYDADLMTLELEAIGRLASRATLPVARDLAKRTMAIGKTLVSTQAFDEAKQVTDIMPKLLVKARDRELSAEFREFRSSIDSQMKAAKERAEQEQAFARKRSRMMRLATESADDPDVCLEAGLFFCFEAGDWNTGLPLLANGSDQELAALVRAEAEAKDGYQLYEVADGWTKWAEKQKADRQAPALDRSILILTNLTTLATGLDKIRIEKRLSDVRMMRAPIGGSNLQADYILDFAPGAAAAYSLRNLSRGHHGPVVTVRRSTDSAERAFKASEIDDARLAEWCGGGDGFVTQWWDQSGHARHATQTTTRYQPKVVSNGALVTEGGKAAVQFDGNNDSLVTAEFFVRSSTIAVFAVFRNPDSSAINKTQYLLDGTNEFYRISVYKNSPPAYPTADSYTVWTASSTGASTSYTAKQQQPAGSITVMSILATSGSSAVHESGALTGSGSAAESGLKLLTIGSRYNSLQFFNATISEIIIHPADMSTSRQEIEANMARYY